MAENLEAGAFVLSGVYWSVVVTDYLFCKLPQFLCVRLTKY